MPSTSPPGRPGSPVRTAVLIAPLLLATILLAVPPGWWKATAVIPVLAMPAIVAALTPGRGSRALGAPARPPREPEPPPAAPAVGSMDYRAEHQLRAIDAQYGVGGAVSGAADAQRAVVWNDEVVGPEVWIPPVDDTPGRPGWLPAAELLDSLPEPPSVLDGLHTPDCDPEPQGANDAALDWAARNEQLPPAPVDRVVLPRLGGSVGYDDRGAWTQEAGQPRVYHHGPDGRPLPEPSRMADTGEIRAVQWGASHHTQPGGGIG